MAKNLKNLKRWAPSARTPMSQAIFDRFSRMRLFRSAPAPGIVSEEACDDILQRLSPYLRRNPPLDIIDLWPMSGVFSSKINKYLRPRRHILIEPDLHAYRPFLTTLANSDPSYTLLSEHVYRIRDWDQIFADHLPEQCQAKEIPKGVMLPKNDTLLVIANVPPQASKKEHNTPARWWAAMMDSCLRRQDLHRYGSVRIIATFPTEEVHTVLPRQLADRKRVSFLTENVALHALDIAATKHQEPWHSLKSLVSITRNLERAEERREARGIVTPAGREVPKLVPAPSAPDKQIGVDLTDNEITFPRVQTEIHLRWMDDVEKHNKLLAEVGAHHADTKKAAKKASTSRAALRRENGVWSIRQNLLDAQLRIDRRMQELSRAAADPKQTAADLERLDREVAALVDRFETEKSQSFDRFLDDARVEASSEDLDGSPLMWDRRPFNPLTLHEHEVYPYDPRTVLYFEADENPIGRQYLERVPEAKREQLQQIFDALTFSGTSTPLTVEELSNAIFPGQPVNHLVRDIPELAGLARKRLKPGCGPVPLPDPTLDAAKCFQENIDYDLSDLRVRTLPIRVIWEILLLYHANAMDLSYIQFSRLLGGAITTYRHGVEEFKA
ncbi:hypothetical protein N7468_009524 [Penicillium chermesinum]|uniref:rRNA adenine N(6)-methyltransferase n=1 Tax=Penicillium chermesinum TaxID=63820 RepID=A0A9W9NHZ1_9EURO|nr:uncharacterized protein N7468_009524 [Penicillium chermesinum]KAJ5220320.1 hypothetical protein N7468_009524 [Penicillium chermesinum]KAJ6157763.1 hypothetical protein N7470_005355 [Penicillium chermesinum]